MKAVDINSGGFRIMSHLRFISLIFFAGVLILVSVIAPCISDDTVEKERTTIPGNTTVIDQLRAITVDKSTEIKDQHTIDIMKEAAQTKRVDALALLIKNLAYHRSLLASNEPPDQLDIIPAVRLLKEHFGSLALPYLYSEGINTDKLWLRKRCAFAIRMIATKDEMGRYNTTFALKETNSPGGKALLTLLAMKQIDATSFEELTGAKILPASSMPPINKGK